MFNHGKFNIKRFNLPSADVTDIEYRDDFASALLALVDFGQNVHLQEKQSGDVNAAVIAGALIDASASGGDTLSALVKLRADYIVSENLSDSIRAQIKLSINHFIVGTLQGIINQRAALGEDIYINPDMTGLVEQITALGASYTASEIYCDETLNCLIATAIFDTLTLKISLQIPEGGKLVIDSDNYNVLLNAENAIDKHSGDWVFLSRAVDKITFRPYGANVKISMLYTERYL